MGSHSVVGGFDVVCVQRLSKGKTFTCRERQRLNKKLLKMHEHA